MAEKQFVALDVTDLPKIREFIALTSGPPEYIDARVSEMTALVNKYDSAGADYGEEKELMAQEWASAADLAAQIVVWKKALAGRALRATASLDTQAKGIFDQLELDQEVERRWAFRIGAGAVALVTAYGVLFWYTFQVEGSAIGVVAQWAIVRLVLLLVVIRIALGMGRNAVERLQVARAIRERGRDLRSAIVAMRVASPEQMPGLREQLVAKLLRPSSFDR